MKYLKFYEAFKSKGISNTIKFLREKVGSNASNYFLTSLKDLMENINFPIDKISDDDIEYVNAKKAISLKSENRVNNENGIWVIKYWFSIKEGFLGYTATGNVEEEFNELGSSNNLRKAEYFSDNELEHIKNNVQRNGEIWPVTDYKKLKTGDTVIGQFSDFSFENIIMAKIFIDDDNRAYAIQGHYCGSESSNPEWRRYTQYGSLSWWIYDDSEMGNDHRKLHFFRPSESELHYIEPPKEEKDEDEKVEKEPDPLNWNLPLSSRFSFSTWRRGSSMSHSNLKDADFALILYYDKLINSSSNNYIRPSETRNIRAKQKEGATKLMSDEEIKKMNIENYVQKLVVSLNITETEFFNLEKIVSKHLAQEFSYISILVQRPDWSDLSDFTNYLYNIVDNEGSTKNHYLERTKDLYSSRTKNYYAQLSRFQEAKKFIKGDSNLKKIFDEIFKLGSEINQIFINKKIDSIDDLWLVRTKIKSLYDFIRMSRNQLSYKVRETISGFRYVDEIEYYFNQYKDNYPDEDYREDLEKIKRIRSFIKSI
jgi:hypothetical protein